MEKCRAPISVYQKLFYLFFGCSWNKHFMRKDEDFFPSQIPPGQDLCLPQLALGRDILCHSIRNSKRVLYQLEPRWQKKYNGITVRIPTRPCEKKSIEIQFTTGMNGEGHWDTICDRNELSSWTTWWFGVRPNTRTSSVWSRTSNQYWIAACPWWRVSVKLGKWRCI